MQVEKDSSARVEGFPKISVCVVAFNQKEYLRECLEGLVNQEFPFSYEIIVGDDASTDGTVDVIKEFARRYPRLIVPLFHLKNIGPFKNYLATHSMARGDYVCHMDGDDLAYPGKLRIQSDFLDANKNHQVVWHRVTVFNDDRSLLRDSHEVERLGVDAENLTQRDLLMYGSIGFHSSMMYRNDLHAREFLRKIRESKNDFIDYLIAVEFLSAEKLAASLNNVLGGYRYNSNKQTLSKMSKGLFKKQMSKVLLLEHLKYFSEKYPEYRSRIFVNAMVNALGDIRRLRGTALGYSILALRCFSLEGILFFLAQVNSLRRLRTA